MSIYEEGTISSKVAIAIVFVLPFLVFLIFIYITIDGRSEKEKDIIKDLFVKHNITNDFYCSELKKMLKYTKPDTEEFKITHIE